MSKDTVFTVKKISDDTVEIRLTELNGTKLPSLQQKLKSMDDMYRKYTMLNHRGLIQL